MAEAMDPLAAIEAAAAQDPEFKDALLANPRAAVEEKTGHALPDDWALAAHLDDTGAARLGFVDDELPASYLDMAAGGGIFDDIWRGFEKVYDKVSDDLGV